MEIHSRQGIAYFQDMNVINRIINKINMECLIFETLEGNIKLCWGLKVLYSNLWDITLRGKMCVSYVEGMRKLILEKAHYLTFAKVSGGTKMYRIIKEKF